MLKIRSARIPLLLALLFSSCASYSRATKQGLDAFEHRDFSYAESIYDKGAETDGVDQLVYLFDRGTVRYTAGEYEKSVQDFLLADRLSEIKDYTALATEVATIITNDRITQYKGEEFEHVLASMYLALNFAAMGKDEDATVACRRVNRKLELLRSEGKRKYDLNAFAQYLAGILFERDSNWNIAYVDYKKTYEIGSHFSRLKMDLLKGALKMDSSRDLNRWRRELGITDQDIREAKREMKETGGVVLLYQNGLGPEKIPSPSWHELPEYQLRYNRHRAAHLYLNGEHVARTEILYDVEKVALENMRSKYATYLLKRVAGVAAREVIGNSIDEKHPGLGTVVKIAMFAASQPDLRAWLTLPKNYQVARVQVKPGKYQASLRLENIQGNLEEEKDLGEVTVRSAGDVALLQWRSLND